MVVSPHCLWSLAFALAFFPLGPLFFFFVELLCFFPMGAFAFILLQQQQTKYSYKMRRTRLVGSILVQGCRIARGPSRVAICYCYSFCRSITPIFVRRGVSEFSVALNQRSWSKDDSFGCWPLFWSLAFHSWPKQDAGLLEGSGGCRRWILPLFDSNPWICSSTHTSITLATGERSEAEMAPFHGNNRLYQ